MMEHNKPSKSQIIVSSYVNGGRPSRERLGNLVACMQSTGADVVKLIVEVNYITEVAPILQMLTHCQVIPQFLNNAFLYLHQIHLVHQKVEFK